MHSQPAAPLVDIHPVPAPVRTLIDALVLAVRTADDPAIQNLLTQLAPLANTTTLLLLRYRLDLDKDLSQAATTCPPTQLNSGGRP
ncbi:hypothetical protein [Streptomyces chartreusis]|uniref:hypothetical protein n=1 Tax=Streptomyces chartreusis TaxID=1969 RepID=UPI00366116FB